jgi:hypothetical protein
MTDFLDGEYILEEGQKLTTQCAWRIQAHIQLNQLQTQTDFWRNNTIINQQQDSHAGLSVG